jgi:hypothetical protein
MPTPAVEKLFMHSFDLAAAGYRSRLVDAEGGKLHLENTNFDLGVVARPGEYKLQDDAYAFWLNALAENKYAGLTPLIRTELLNYYSNLTTPLDTKKHKKDWNRLLAELNDLKTTNPGSELRGTK